MLLPETHAEQRTPRVDRPPDATHRLAGVRGPSRTGTDAHGIRGGDRFGIQAFVIVTQNVDARTERTEEVGEVVRERIVIVHE
jgi:hypothetical protein